MCPSTTSSETEDVFPAGACTKSIHEHYLIYIYVYTYTYTVSDAMDAWAFQSMSESSCCTHAMSTRKNIRIYKEYKNNIGKTDQVQGTSRQADQPKKYLNATGPF